MAGGKAIHEGLLDRGTRRQHLLCSAAAAVFALGAASATRAAPDACDLSGDTAVCSGDQSLGISGTVGGDFAPSTIEILSVQNLDRNIAPIEGVHGIEFESASNIRIIADIGPYSVVTTGDGIGILAQAEAASLTSGDQNVLVENRGGVEAGGSGIVAHAYGDDFRFAGQITEQSNSSLESTAAEAQALDAGKTVEAMSVLRQDDLFFSQSVQGGFAPSIGGAATVSVENSGSIAAGEHGIVASTGLDIGTIGIQEIAQENEAEFLVGARAGAVGRGTEVFAYAEAVQEAGHLNESAQTLNMAGVQGSGNVRVLNAGEIEAGGSGIRAGSQIDSADPQVQLSSQANDAEQDYGAEPSSGDVIRPSSLARSEEEGLSLAVTLSAQEAGQKNSADQRMEGLGVTGSGRVIVENTGLVFAEEEGILAGAQLTADRLSVQEAEQENQSEQQSGSDAEASDEGGALAVGLAMQRSEQLNQTVQSALNGGYAGSANSVVINSGGIAAEGAGIVVGAGAALGDESSQDVFQDNESEQDVRQRALSGSASGALAAGAGLRETAQLNEAEQSLEQYGLEGAGRATVVNEGIVAAAGPGIEVGATMSLSSLSEQASEQSNESGQFARQLAETEEGGSLAVGVLAQRDAQMNSAGQWQQGPGASGAAGATLVNEGLVVADGDGLAAGTFVMQDDLARQGIDQGNAVERNSDVAAFGAEGEALAGALLLSEFAQRNEVFQLREAGSLTSVGAITLANQGTVLAGGDGIAAGASLHTAEASEQIVLQGNDISQSTLVDSAAVGDAAALAASVSGQTGEHDNEAVQIVERGGPAGGGSVVAVNDGLVVAEERGLAVSSDLELAASADQVNIQGNDTSVLTANRLHADQGEAVSLLPYASAGRQYNETEQQAQLGSAAEAGRVVLVNQGDLFSGKEGMSVARSLVRNVELSQDSRQENEIDEMGVSVSGADGEDATGVSLHLGAQQTDQRNSALQVMSDGGAAAAGSITLVNEGLVLAEGHGVAVEAAQRHRIESEQKGLQGDFNWRVLWRDNGAQEGFSIGEAGSAAQSGRENDLVQRSEVNSLEEAGAIFAINEGSVTAEGDGVRLRSSNGYERHGQQELDQGTVAFHEASPLSGARDSGSHALDDLASAHEEASRNEALQMDQGADLSGFGGVSFENSGLVAAMGDGLLVESELLLADTRHQAIEQDNLAEEADWVELESEEGVTLTEVADFGDRVQVNQALQRSEGGSLDEAGLIEILNSGEVMAMGHGVAARSGVVHEDTALQLVDQGNDIEGYSETYAYTAGDGMAANVDEHEGQTVQINAAVQGNRESSGDRVGAMAIVNSGEILAGGDGILAVNQHSHTGGTHQISDQGSRSSGYDWASLDDSTAAADSADLMNVEVLNVSDQDAESASGEEQGAIYVENSGLIEAAGDGIAAATHGELGSFAIQAADQTLSGMQAAFGRNGDRVQAQSLFQSHDNRQQAERSVGDRLGAVRLENSGLVMAEGDGLVAGSAWRVESSHHQEVWQANDLVQLRHSDSGAEQILVGEQSSENEQSSSSSFGQEVGALDLRNDGTVMALGDGMWASSRVESHWEASQSVGQIDGLVQVANRGRPEDMDAPALQGQAFEHHLLSEQDLDISVGDDLGAVRVRNSGEVMAEGDGLRADPQVSLGFHLTQHQRQNGDFIQTGQSATAVDLEQDQIGQQSKHGAQSARFRLGDGTASVLVENSGLLLAGGDGLVAASRLDLDLSMEQSIEQRGYQLQRMSAEEVEQSQAALQDATATQEVNVDLGHRAGAVTVLNSGMVDAEGDGIRAESHLSLGLSAPKSISQSLDGEQRAAESLNSDQATELSQSQTAAQSTLVSLGEEAAFVRVENDGLVLAEGDGVTARARADLSIGQVLGEAEDSAEWNSSQEASSGVAQDYEVDQLQDGDQMLAVHLVEDITGIEVSNSGAIIAGGAGIVAESAINVTSSQIQGLGMPPHRRILIENDGLILARETGIRAASQLSTPMGAGHAGDIEITIGEAGAVLSENGYAIDIEGGADNLLTNHGAIASDAERAIRGGAGNETVVNHGWVYGSVDLGTGRNRFDNRAGALFEPGRLVALGGGELRNAGDLSPGGSGRIEHTKVEGDLRFADGSRYLLDIAPENRSDRLIVEGAASIEAGVDVAVEKAQGAYPYGTRFEILNASEGVEGTFAGVVQDRPFLEFRLDHGTNVVALDVGRSGTDFVTVAGTKNQRAVAGALESFGRDTDNPLYTMLVWADEEEARELYDTLSGEIHATAQAAPVDIARRTRSQLLGRLSGFGAGFAVGSGGEQNALQANSLASLAVSDAREAERSSAEPGQPALGPAAWVQAHGSSGSLDSDGNAAETDTQSWGTMLGAEMLFSENFGMGLAFGFQDDRLETAAQDSRTEIGTYSISTYGLWQSGAWRLRGGAGFGWHDFESRRTVSLSTGNETAKADYKGWSAQSFGEVGYRLPLGTAEVEPFAGLAFQHTRIDSYSESGAGAANLDIDSDRASTLHSSLGVTLSETFSFDSGLRLRPHASVAWERRLVGSSGDARMAFSSGGSSFSVSGPKRSKDAAVVGVGLDIGLDNNVEAFAGYDAYLSSTQKEHTARAGIRLRF